MSSKAEKIVVTGATGFAGSHILERFGERADVIAACRTKEKLPEYYQKEAVTGDLRDDAYIEVLSERADVLCHAASWAELNGSVADSKREFLEPTLKLIDAAAAAGVKRFVFLSAITSKPIEEGRVHTALALEKIWAHYASIVQIEKYLKEVSRNSKMEIVILRAGYFTGKNYALGLLPILLPRMKTHLVPYIENGNTTLPLIDGRDLGEAFVLASTASLKSRFNVTDVVGKEIPTVKEVFGYLHEKYGYPLPHFSVSFLIAYLFARFMRALYKVLPGDPLIVPSIVLLLEETHATNENAKALLGYKPEVDWRESVDLQIAQMQEEQKTNMRMNKQ